ncbi:MAG: hydrogenase nickel incorporation protein HypB [Bacteroidales bacterium]|nr:hydrogenase nickel incorporation protein HypB [Bacteroidales bacterium]
MCDTCGCGSSETRFTIKKPGQAEYVYAHTDHDHDHTHHHNHDHVHPHDHNHVHSHGHDFEHLHDHHNEKTISIETDVLQKNNLLAQRNRGYFEAKAILALNMVSSPGSGKTTILERTLHTLKDRIKISVIEGDQQTTLDANRISATTVPVVQINTGSGCHLDAAMINKAVKELDPPDKSLLMIENVGNLVCPALFDLGENFRVVIVSVTEGEDKPLKYPQMFMSSQICLINKTDLLPYVDFSVDKLKEYINKVNHHLVCIELSAKTGEGFDKWIDWLRGIVKSD